MSGRNSTNARRRESHHASFVGAVCVVAVCFWSSSVLAENGDLLGVSEVLTGTDIVDITADSSDGSFWVQGANGQSLEGHQIYHLTSALDGIIETYANPHSAGADISELTTNRGIAYEPFGGGALFILASVGAIGNQRLEVRQVHPDNGEEVGARHFVVDPGGVDLAPDASLFGLSYDIVVRHFWTLDIQNEVIIRFAKTGQVMQTITVPGKTTDNTRFHGAGIAFDFDGAATRVHISWGNIFSLGPSKILELDPNQLAGNFGVRTGVEVPLTDIVSSSLWGIQTYTAPPNQKRIAIVGGDGTIYQVERSSSEPLAPTEVSCFLTLGNQVQVTWENHGTEVGDAYGGQIQVLRNGVPLITLAGSETSFLDETPVEGSGTYSVRAAAVGGGLFSDESCPCHVTVGPGGLINWAPFPGVSVFDVAEVPGTGDIFATDNLLGTLFKLDADFNVVGEFTAPLSDPPGGVAFVPSITVGGILDQVVLTDMLAVASSGGDPGNRVVLVSVDDPGGMVERSLNLRFPDEVSPPRIGGMTYIEENERFVVLERNTGEIFTFDRNGSPVGLGRCTASPFPFPLPDLDMGISYDPIQQGFLTSFVDGGIREMFNPRDPSVETFCTTSGFGFSLGGLGPSFDTPGFAKGVEVSGNTLLVAGHSSNALFRVLIFPFSPDFIRGDFDGINGVNITDAYNLAQYLFLQGAAPQCADAADVNDDGVLDVSDPVWLLFALFVQGSPPPRAPFPEPGNDPTFRDNLGCR